jgi:hypothetical protein
MTSFSTTAPLEFGATAKSLDVRDRKQRVYVDAGLAAVHVVVRNGGNQPVVIRGDIGVELADGRYLRALSPPELVARLGPDYPRLVFAGAAAAPAGGAQFPLSESVWRHPAGMGEALVWGILATPPIFLFDLAWGAGQSLTAAASAPRHEGRRNRERRLEALEDVVLSRNDVVDVVFYFDPPAPAGTRATMPASGVLVVPYLDSLGSPGRMRLPFQPGPH